MAEKRKIKVLFQSMNPQLFRANFIGYLYEIAQKYRVVLLTDEMSSSVKEILNDKKIFPGLEKIVSFESAFGRDVFGKNYRLCSKLKETVRDFKPDIVVTHTDFWPADMYLLRFAKRAGAITVVIQANFKIAGERKLYLWSSIMNAYLKMPSFLPLPFRIFLAKLKKYLGNFFYYWLLPLLAGEMPFLGKSSFIFWDEASGLRDADYSAVFSKRDYDLLKKDGVNPEKLFILGHPLEHKEARKFFEKHIFKGGKKKENRKTLTIMWPDEKIALSREKYSLISEIKLKESRQKMIRIISDKLPGWKIFIKPHPAVKNISEVKNFLGPITDNVSIVEPSEPADKYIEMSGVILGTPPPSTTLFTASLQNPEKTIIFLDLNHEALSDTYKNFKGIEYIDNERDFERILGLISGNKYKKESVIKSESEFSDAVEMLDFLYQKSLKRNI